MLENDEISKDEYDDWRYTYSKIEMNQYNNETDKKTANNLDAYEEMEYTIPNIETYYLIGFENINDAGLACSNQLGSQDHILIFSTKNAPKINLESLAAFNDVDFHSHIISAGKQSLDMHLVAYLGCVIGKNASKNCKYIIVNKDNDYDNIISFLKNFSPSIITRQLKIDSGAQKITAAAKPAPSSDKAAASAKKHSLTLKSNIVSARLDTIKRSVTQLPTLSLNIMAANIFAAMFITN